MFLKNYTSDVPVARTISNIEQILAECGATHIAKEYSGTSVIALQFVLIADGVRHVIKLPSNPEAVYDALRAEVKRPRRGTMDKVRAQSERTAWKLMEDWVRVQLSLILMKQADILQVFLPYVWNGKVTYYEALKGSGFKNLLISEKSSS